MCWVHLGQLFPPGRHRCWGKVSSHRKRYAMWSNIGIFSIIQSRKLKVNLVPRIFSSFEIKSLQFIMEHLKLIYFIIRILGQRNKNNSWKLLLTLLVGWPNSSPYHLNWRISLNFLDFLAKETCEAALLVLSSSCPGAKPEL